MTPFSSCILYIIKWYQSRLVSQKSRNHPWHLISFHQFPYLSITKSNWFNLESSFHIYSPPFIATDATIIWDAMNFCLDFLLLEVSTLSSPHTPSFKFYKCPVPFSHGITMSLELTLPGMLPHSSLPPTPPTSSRHPVLLNTWLISLRFYSDLSSNLTSLRIPFLIPQSISGPHYTVPCYGLLPLSRICYHCN